MIKSIQVALISAVIFLLTLSLSFAADKKIPGKYDIVGNIESLKNVKQIELTEFFNFSCGHCYKFLSTAGRLQAKYKDKLVHKSMPIFWGEQTPYPSMLYLIGSDKGTGEKCKNEIFNARFKTNIDTFDLRMISYIAGSLGLGEDFDKAVNDSSMKKRVEDILKKASDYNVHGTPTIVLNGVISVNPEHTGGDVEKMTDNIDQIIEYLLKN